MEMTPETIKALLDAFDRSDWREMTVTIGTDSLYVSRDPSPNGASPAASATDPAAAVPAPPPALPAPAIAAPPPSTPDAGPAAAGAPGPAPATPAAADVTATADVPASGTAIESPSVGLFWRAPSPGAPPFVEVGQEVAAGDTVAIVEVMKLMNHVVAPVAGVVTAIVVENGAAVEFGQTLVVVDPEG